MTVELGRDQRPAGDVHVRAADLPRRPERPERSRSRRARRVEREPGQRDEPEPAGLLAAGRAATSQNGTQCPANKLVITPSAPIPERHDLHRHDRLHRPPGRARRRRRLDRGLVPRQYDRRADDGAFVTTEPVGTDVVDAAQQPPDARSRPTTSTTRPTSARRRSPRRARRLHAADRHDRTRPVPPTSREPARRELPRRLVRPGTGTRRSRSRTTSSRTASARYDLIGADEPDVGDPVLRGAGQLDHGRPEGDEQDRDGQAGGHRRLPDARSTGRSRSRPTASSSASRRRASRRRCRARSPSRAGRSAAPPARRWARSTTRTCTSGSATTSPRRAFNLTFWKEGFATLGEYLTHGPRHADRGGSPGRRPRRRFENSLISRFNTNYNTTSSSFWTAAPSNPTVGNLFTTSNTYTRPGTAYIALWQILGRDRMISAMKEIQSHVRRRQHHRAAARGRSSASACRSRARRATRGSTSSSPQWCDTAYPTGGANTTNKPQITGPGLNGTGFVCAQVTSGEPGRRRTAGTRARRR